MARFKSTRKGALGALMDLYEEEAEFFVQTINAQVDQQDWAVIKDEKTEDPDCRSIKTIAEHMVGAAYYYVELLKKAEITDYKMVKHSISLSKKTDFEPAFREALNYQVATLEGRWELSDEAIEKIVIKTGWGNVLDPESLLEHAVLHIMRHHRQILRWMR